MCYRGRGFTNGEFRGVPYFQCEENCGMFVSLEKISPLARVGTQTGSHIPIDKLQISRRVSQEIQPPLTAKDLPFKRGNRVVVHNKKGVVCRGTVKWIGNTTGKLNFPIAGIEMVSNTHVCH